MELKIIDQDFSVCKIKEFSPDLLKDGFCFIGRTDEELSLVCAAKHVRTITSQKRKISKRP